MTTRFDRFVQEGRGCFLVRYVGTIRAGEDAGAALYADLVPEHLERLAEAIGAASLVDAVDGRSADRRSEVLASVRRALSAPSASDRQDVADDIAIWWLYEYLDGRGAEHVVSDWQSIVCPSGPTGAASPPRPRILRQQEEKWPRGLKRTERKARR